MSTRQYLSVSQVALALCGVITRRGRIFLGFYLPYIDAPDFLKFILSSGTAAEATAMWERGSSRLLLWYIESFASRPSFLIQPKLAAVSNHYQLTAVWWPTHSDLASSSYQADVCSIASVSVAGMCFIFRDWKMWVYLNCSYFCLGRLKRTPEFRQQRPQHVHNDPSTVEVNPPILGLNPVVMVLTPCSTSIISP